MLARFDHRLLAANRWLVIALLAAMAVMVFANVALRFLTDRSILWVEEASRYTMVWLTFVGAGTANTVYDPSGVCCRKRSPSRFSST